MNLSSTSTAIRSLKIKKEDIFNKLDPRFIESDCALHLFDWCLIAQQLQILLDDVSWEFSALFLLILRDHLQSNEITHRGDISNIAFEKICGLLEHDEPRVRLLATEVVRHLSHIETLQVYDTLAPILISRIRELFHRTESTRPAVLGPKTRVELDDTTGWRSLETTVIAFKQLLTGYCSRTSFAVSTSTATLETCGPTQQETGTEESSRDRICALLDSKQLNDDIFALLITDLSTHINRHIRQVCLDLICIVISALRTLHWSEPRVPNLCVRVTEALKTGLQDNWSQVRYAACVTCRTFLLALSEEERELVWEALLPRVCLNRFFVAEGVRGHTQETWRLAVGTRGRELVARHMESIVSYYTEMSRAPNHMVAEAACQAMAELAQKVDRSAVGPYAAKLLEALLECAEVDSWPIRDAACGACGVFVRHYPEQETDTLDSLFSLWTTHLRDSIWSIRDNAALATGELLLCDNTDLRSRALQLCVSHLAAHVSDALSEPTPEQQRARTVQFLPPRVLAQLTEKKGMHTSSGQRLRVSRADWGCCLDCVVVREGRPWESSDGAVFLLREMAKAFPAEAESFLPRVWALLDVSHFRDCDKLHTSVLQQLPGILERVGKKATKRDLADHLPALSRAMRSESPAVGMAAQECVTSISAQIGSSIFMHRVPDELKPIFQTLLHQTGQGRSVGPSPCPDSGVPLHGTAPGRRVSDESCTPPSSASSSLSLSLSLASVRAKAKQRKDKTETESVTTSTE
mmetsp:Transcript_30782/g.31331  ORF Transcript_30782/g.31331 Transcript_30782/m.31331 type:complete len:751 (+) Transcript_30782:229-2481(+)